jgi:hypothetical protein
MRNLFMSWSSDVTDAMVGVGRKSGYVVVVGAGGTGNDLNEKLLLRVCDDIRACVQSSFGVEEE